jgi:streptogramin lyase
MTSKVRTHVGTHIHNIGTKRFPSLQKKTEVFKTNYPTRRGYKAYTFTYSLDGAMWFRTAKEAKASVTKGDR